MSKRSNSINNTFVDNISTELRLGIGISRAEENKRRAGTPNAFRIPKKELVKLVLKPFMNSKNQEQTQNHSLN